MKITTRPFKSLGRHAQFTPEGERLLVSDGYIYLLDVPSLQTIYRIRPLPGMSGAALQPNGTHMLAAYDRGHYAVLRVADGEVVATCGSDGYVGDQYYQLSDCGAYIVRLRYFRDIHVIEVATGRVVWERRGQYQRAAPLGADSQWVIVVDQVAEIWSWPFGEKPHRTIPLGCMANDFHVRDSKVALNLYKTIRVVDLNTGDTLAEVPAESLTRAALRDDGSLVVSNRGELCVYSAQGALVGRLRAPEMYFFGHAFHSKHDDAALMFERGIVFIRDLASALAAQESIEPVWPALTQGQPSRGGDYAVYSATPSGEMSAVIAETDRELKQAISRFKRAAWRPQLRGEAGSPDGSKFGGVPWLGKNEEWPRCSQCNQPMNLYLQLNSADLPAECQSLFSGVLQLFLCSTETYSGGLCQSSEPFSGAQRVRVVQPDGPSSVSELIDETLFAEMQIIGWTATEDYPDNGEIEQLGVELDDDQQELNGEGDWLPSIGDKLLGWPAWQQGIERIRCPECDSAMKEIFQIESCDALPLMLGDGGRGWIRQCPSHAHQVCFGWQCG